jgi:hypothetical protein
VKRAILLVLWLGAAACSPAPGAARYFKANPAETRRVLADRIVGAHRGGDWRNAGAAPAKLESGARLKLYQQNV